MRLLRNCLAISFLLLSSVWASAQVTTGTISGTITDPSGAVLPNVKVEITSEGTGVSRVVTTDAGGRYSAPLLPVGEYRISSSIEGFQTEVRSGVVLNVGREATVDIRLQVGAVSQTVEVTGEAPLVQTTESSVSYTVQDAQLRDLPLNGRDMSQLILLNPGVNVSNTQGAQAFNGYGARISIAGMRGEDNTYLMDGQLIGDFRRHIPAGPSGAMLGVESVQEFQVITNSVSAQYGRVLGGVFNAVSKSGTNSFHGDAYDFLRNDKMDAARWEDNRVGASKPAFRRNQFGGTIGGPIMKDKLFFWAGYETTQQVLHQIQTPTTMDANLRRGFLPNGNCLTTGTPPRCVVVNPTMLPYINQYPLPSTGGQAFGDGTQQFVFDYRQPTKEHFGQARVDLPTLRANDSVFVRFTGSSAYQPVSSGFPGFEQQSGLNSWLLTLSETHIISAGAINNLRIHFSRVRPDDEGVAPAPTSPACPGPSAVGTDCILIAPGQRDVPELAITGLPNNYGGGGFATKPTIMTANRFTYQDDVSWRIGGHSIQFGGFVERFQLNSVKPNRAWGVWTFTSVANFLENVSTQFRGAVPGFGISNYRRGLRNWMFALYVQDDWRVNDRLTINAGVRWEPYTIPTEVNGLIANLRSISDTTGTLGDPYWQNHSKGDFGPRLGFAWSPFTSGKTSVRAGFGLLYAPNDPNLYYNQMDRMPPLGFDFTLNIPAGCNRFPDAVAELNALTVTGCPAGARPLQSPAYVVPFQDSFDSRAAQWNFNVQQQLTGDSIFSLGYAGSRGTHLLSVGDYNMPRAVFNGQSLEVPLNATLVNPAWPSILLFANNTSSTYHAMLMSYQKRFSSGLQATFSYTWSKTQAGADSGQTGGGVTTGGGRQKYPYENAAQWGLSGYDFRQVLSVNYSYEFPFGKGTSGWVKNLLSGWRTTGVISVRPGQPINLSSGVSTATTAPAGSRLLGTALTSLAGLAVTPRSPNANADYKQDPREGTSPGCQISSIGQVFMTGTTPPAGTSISRTVAAGTPLGTPELYYDPCAFSAPDWRELGNLGRNTMIGPSFRGWNPAIAKTTPLTESVKLEFRAEFFNFFNKTNLGAPSNTVHNAAGAPQAAAGTITSTIGSPRQMQFALKLLW